MRRVILNADDLGYDPAVTEGILQAMREGVVSSTTFIANSPHSAAAAREARGLPVGLHLNLVRFDALSTKKALVESAAWSLSADFVEAETRAQLERLEALFAAAATHLDVHKHAHLHPPVLEGLMRVALERHLPVRSITPEMRQTLRARGVHTNDVFLGESASDAFWTEDEFERQLDRVPAEGVVELMCHPGHVPTHLMSGYSAQREVELSTFLSTRAKAALRARGLTLESWSGV